MNSLIAHSTLFCILFTPALAGQNSIDQRQARQQARIEQGIANGSLNTSEAQRLSAHADKLAAREAAARADGRLSRGERTHLQLALDKQSLRITRQKHDL